MARRHNCRRVVPQEAGNDDVHVRLHVLRRNGNAGIHLPHPGGIDIEAVPCAAPHHFRIPGHNHDTGFLRRLPHIRQHSAQISRREAFFQDEGQRQIPRRRAGHGQIVHRAADGQPPDAPSGKKEGLHHEGVGGKGHRSFCRQDSPVVKAVQNGISQGGQDILLHEGMPHLSPRTVRHLYRFIRHIETLLYRICTTRRTRLPPIPCKARRRVPAHRRRRRGGSPEASPALSAPRRSGRRSLSAPASCEPDAPP